MGKKIIDFIIRRHGLRGRKSEAGRGKLIKGHRTVYTPATLVCLSNELGSIQLSLYHCPSLLSFAGGACYVLGGDVYHLRPDAVRPNRDHLAHFAQAS